MSKVRVITFIELKPREKDNRILTLLERVGADNYLHKKDVQEREHIDSKVQCTSERYAFSSTPMFSGSIIIAF